MISAKKSLTSSHKAPNFSQMQKQIKKYVAADRRHFNPAFECAELRQKLIFTCIRPMCDLLELSQNTYYLTVSVMDHISSLFRFDSADLKKLAFVSLCLASKLFEHSSKKMSFGMLKQYLPADGFDYASFESSVLSALNFDLNFRGPYDFVVLFMQDAGLYWQIENNLLLEFVSWLSELTFYCSVEYRFNKYSSLGMAVSMVMVTRKVFGCSTVLPKFLGKLTGYSCEYLRDIYSKIYFYAKKLLRAGKIPKPVVIAVATFGGDKK